MAKRTGFIAALKYRIEVMADNWKHIEDVLNKANERVLANIVNLCDYGTSKRKK